MKEQLARVRTEPEHKIYGQLDYFEEMLEHINDLKWCLRKVKIKDFQLDVTMQDVKDLIDEHYKERKRQAQQITRDVDKANKKKR